MEADVRTYLAEIGRKGGRRSKRQLDSETAREMVRVREARRAYRRYHSRCFWSFDPEYVIRAADVAWVADRLRRHGGRQAWDLARKLCP